MRFEILSDLQHVGTVLGKYFYGLQNSAGDFHTEVQGQGTIFKDGIGRLILRSVDYRKIEEVRGKKILRLQRSEDELRTGISCSVTTPKVTW